MLSSYSHSYFHKENVHILIFIFNNTTYYIENAEITPELHDDLINFSFDKLQDVFKNYHTFFNRHGFTLLTFIPYLLADLKKLVGIVSTHA
jgi:TPP-dependent 2-oxoacid decarboxylase